MVEAVNHKGLPRKRDKCKVEKQNPGYIEPYAEICSYSVMDCTTPCEGVRKSSSLFRNTNAPLV